MGITESEQTFETNMKHTINPCDRHKPKSEQVGYLKWYEWAEQKKKHGAKQRQCPKCGRWYFKEEY